ncbi:MAG: FCD domain-containing protein [Chloroflexi bacterium]|nr:FCD domain-containing protein [Chloroflexota bacterium]
MLTKEGQVYLEGLEQARAMAGRQTDLMRAIQIETLEDLLQSLNARRGVEAEAARLAAVRATDAEVAEIEKSIRKHISLARSGKDVAQANREIHILIAEAARSRVLEAVIKLLFEYNTDPQIQAVGLETQRASHAINPEDHLAILDAIRARQPGKAEEAMKMHIDRLIRVVTSSTAGEGNVHIKGTAETVVRKSAAPTVGDEDGRKSR